MNEREPFARRSLTDQRRRSFAQHLVLDPQPLDFPTKPPHLGAQFTVHGHKPTVINSTRHDQEPCRTVESREHAVAELYSVDRFASSSPR